LIKLACGVSNDTAGLAYAICLNPSNTQWGKPKMQSVSWIISKAGSYLEFEEFNLASASGTGVYIIWHKGQPGRVVKVGQGDIPSRLGVHRRDSAICAYRQRGTLLVTWAIVPAYQLDGIERYLGDYWKPLVGDRFPDVTPIAVNQPF
jgi:hypothetical protein